MAVTRITDVIVPDIWTPYMQERTAERSALFQSGIIATDGEMNELAKGASDTVNVPFFKDLGGSSESDDDNPSNPATADSITTGKDIAVKHFRRKAWGSADLTAALSGDDPMDAIANLVADFWDRDMQKSILLPALNGVFATGGALAGTHVYDIAIEDGNNAAATNLIGSDAIIDSVGLLGDAWEKITGMVVHSVVFRRMQKLNLIEEEYLSEQNITIRRFLGRRVIVDDGMPKVAGASSGQKYTTYLFGNGSLAYGEGAPKVATETDRDSLAGVDYLINRRHFFLHPRGVRWSGTTAGHTPTTGELETAASWTKVYEDKNIAVVKLVTNG